MMSDTVERFAPLSDHDSDEDDAACALLAEALEDQEQASKDGQLQLTPDQERVVKAVSNVIENTCERGRCKGRFVLLTAPAGTGKTVVACTLAERMRQRYGDEAVVMAAPTGAAASRIDGITINKLLGGYITRFDARHNLMLTVGDHLQNRYFARVEALERLNAARLVIIDEISMMSSHFFDQLYSVLSHLPLVVLMMGDFFQLPPVCMLCKSPHMVYQSLAFMDAIGDRHYSLDRVIRQADPLFVAILQRIRIGQELDDSQIELLRSCHTTQEEVPDDYPRIFGDRRSVSEYNERVYLSLTGSEKRAYRPKTQFKTAEERKAERQPPVVPPKVEASDKPITKKAKKERPAKEIARGVKAELQKLAGDVEANFSNWSDSFKVGMRVMATTNMRLELFVANGFVGTVEALVEDPAHPGMILSVGVKFDVLPVTLLVPYHRVVIEHKTGACAIVEALFLDRAWAVTIHKCQGATFEKACIEPRVFADGMLYTALSRVKSLQSLKLVGDMGYLYRNRVSSSALRFMETARPASALTGMELDALL